MRGYHYDNRPSVVGRQEGPGPNRDNGSCSFVTAESESARARYPRDALAPFLRARGRIRLGGLRLGSFGGGPADAQAQEFEIFRGRRRVRSPIARRRPILSLSSALCLLFGQFAFVGCALAMGRRQCVVRNLVNSKTMRT